MSTSSLSVPPRAASAGEPSAPRNLSVNGPTFARQRLRLGITGVGLTVVLAATWIALTLSGAVALPAEWRLLPATWPRGLARFADAALAALAVFAVHALFLAPVEFLGGAKVVRQRPPAGAWLRSWARGLAVQGSIFALVAGVMAVLAAQLTKVGADGFAPVAVAIVAALVLIGLQGSVAQAMAATTTRPTNAHVEALARAHLVDPDGIRVVSVDDESFVGGCVGLQSPRLWIPERWTAPEFASLLTTQLVRRQSQLASGARMRGVMGAVLWNATGVLLAVSIVPWSFAEARTYLVLPAFASLWSFVAVLILPTLSRRAVYAADRVAVTRLGTERVASAITQLDLWQDDEPERSPRVETVFHPVPSRGNRLRALRAGMAGPTGGGHQLTRMALFTGTASLSLLGRAVHCNVGRPSLWALYPGD